MQELTVTGIHPLVLTQFQRDCDSHKIPYTIYAKDTLDGQLYRYVQYNLIPVESFDIPSLDAWLYLVVTAIEGKYERSLVVRLWNAAEVEAIADTLRKESERATEAKNNANDASEAVSIAERNTDD